MACGVTEGPSGRSLSSNPRGWGHTVGGGSTGLVGGPPETTHCQHHLTLAQFTPQMPPQVPSLPVGLGTAPHSPRRKPSGPSGTETAGWWAGWGNRAGGQFPRGLSRAAVAMRGGLAGERRLALPQSAGTWRSHWRSHWRGGHQALPGPPAGPFLRPPGTNPLSLASPGTGDRLKGGEVVCQPGTGGALPLPEGLPLALTLKPATAPCPNPSPRTG